MSLLFQSRAFITYWLDAVGRHSLHSPFFYDFFSTVVARDEVTSAYDVPERLRKEMLADTTVINVTDLGAGSRFNAGSTRKLCDIARVSLSPARRSRLLDRIARRFECSHIVELGTSLGINTLYLASGHNRKVTTFEGAPEIAGRAQMNFAKAGADNIDVIVGDIGKTLPDFLGGDPTIDLVFMDANHQYTPTLTYFEMLVPALHARSVVVLDDIHYHAGMEKAWYELQRHGSVWGSADLFRTGILFFDPSLNKQHVVLQY